MKKTLLIVLAAVLILSPVTAFAAFTDTDTASGTPITATGAENLLTYTDGSGNTKAPVPTTDITVNVAAMYGFSGLNAPEDHLTQMPGVKATYLYIITNEGNNSDTFNLATAINYSTSPVARNWAVAIRDAADANTISSIASLGEDAYQTFLVTVVPSREQADSPNASYADVALTAWTNSTPAGRYTGANSTPYGGVAIATDETRTSIEASVMTMSRTATVDAPLAYIVNAGVGSDHDPVPGAIITYTISYANIGGGAAVDAVIVDKVPTNTTGFHMGKTGAVTNANISVPGGTASGWKAYDTTSTNPSTTYGVGNGGQWQEITTGTMHAGAKFIKWEKDPGPVTGGESGTLTWGVVII